MTENLDTDKWDTFKQIIDQKMDASNQVHANYQYMEAIQFLMPAYKLEFNDIIIARGDDDFVFPILSISVHSVFLSIEALKKAILAQFTSIVKTWKTNYPNTPLNKILFYPSVVRKYRVPDSINNDTMYDFARLVILSECSLSINITAPDLEIYYLDDLFDIWREGGSDDLRHWNNVSVEMKNILPDNKSGLPYLPLDSNTSAETGIEYKYRGYLTIFPGEAIFKIRQNYEQRLYSKNIRTEIARSGKNTNIIQMIQKKDLNKNNKARTKPHPYNFFAFNNGIVVLAKNVTIEKDLITKIDGFFIVNGAQTTGSIYSALTDLQPSFPKFYVSAKIIELGNANPNIKDEDILEKLGFDICLFANTQNTVSTKDFASMEALWEKMFPDPDKNNPFNGPSNQYLNEKENIGWYFERRHSMYQDFTKRNSTHTNYIKEKLENKSKDLSKDLSIRCINCQEIAEAWYLMESPEITCLSAGKATESFIKEFNTKDPKNFDEKWRKRLIGRYIFFTTGKQFLDTCVRGDGANFRKPYVLAATAHILNDVLGKIQKTLDECIEQQQYVSGHLQLAICKFVQGFDSLFSKIQQLPRKYEMVGFCRNPLTGELIFEILKEFNITDISISVLDKQFFEKIKCNFNQNSEPIKSNITTKIKAYYDTLAQTPGYKEVCEIAKETDIQKEIQSFMTSIIAFFDVIQHVPEITGMRIVPQSYSDRIPLDHQKNILEMFKVFKDVASSSKKKPKKPKKASKQSKKKSTKENKDTIHFQHNNITCKLNQNSTEITIKSSSRPNNYSYEFHTNLTYTKEYTINKDFIDTLLQNVQGKYVFMQSIEEFIFNNRELCTDPNVSSTSQVEKSIKEYIKAALNNVFFENYLSSNSNWKNTIEIYLKERKGVDKISPYDIPLIYKK